MWCGDCVEGGVLRLRSNNALQTHSSTNTIAHRVQTTTVPNECAVETPNSSQPLARLLSLKQLNNKNKLTFNSTEFFASHLISSTSSHIFHKTQVFVVARFKPIRRMHCICICKHCAPLSSVKQCVCVLVLCVNVWAADYTKMHQWQTNQSQARNYLLAGLAWRSCVPCRGGRSRLTRCMYGMQRSALCWRWVGALLLRAARSFPFVL